jgi:hypothetical protein
VPPRGIPLSLRDVETLQAFRCQSSRTLGDGFDSISVGSDAPDSRYRTPSRTQSQYLEPQGLGDCKQLCNPAPCAARWNAELLLPQSGVMSSLKFLDRTRDRSRRTLPLRMNSQVQSLARTASSSASRRLASDFENTRGGRILSVFA